MTEPEPEPLPATDWPLICWPDVPVNNPQETTPCTPTK